MRLRAVLPALILVLVVVGAAVYFGHPVPASKGQSATPAQAPGFSVPDIFGHTFTLSDFRNNSVVVVEFTALSCSECQIVEQTLHSLYSDYNQTGHTKVHMISVFIEPQFGDSIPALHSYQSKNNVTWTMAQDTNSLSVSRSYGVSAIPAVVVVDLRGEAVYKVSGVQDAGQLKSTIASALSGTAPAIAIVVLSVYALAVLAGVSTFFSPCAFPMFPGYMSLFLGMTTREAAAQPAAKGTYTVAARRAVFAGSITATGMVLTFLIVGAALLLAAKAISGYVPFLMVAVGGVLIALGGLLLTNLQYWKIVSPVQRLWYRMGGKRPEETFATATAPSGRAFYVKLFSYGMGYAAAAAGCVFPVFFAAIVAGLAIGLLGEIINILIFSLTAAVLMIVVTLILGLAGKRYVDQLKAFAPVIKKVSAVALIVVGVYLIYFFYSAWGF